ncbi:MAG: hypothetical protein ACKPFK_22075, partial [Dolichospermum sp.]
MVSFLGYLAHSDDRLYNTVSVNQLLSDRPADYPATNAKPCVIIEPKTMNEQRTQAYLNLINQLLSCPEGQENTILEENGELLDEVLLQKIETMAKEMTERGNEKAAQWVLNKKRRVTEKLGNFSNSS